MIVTVTLNAAIDRTLTVPNFQLGQRHRASAGLTLAGGKGINVARALKRLGVPVVGDRACGRTDRNPCRRGADRRGDPQRLRPDRATSRARRPPSSTRPASSFTEINEWGPLAKPEELEMLLEKLRYLSRGADFVVLAGLSAARGRRRTSTAS